MKGVRGGWGLMDRVRAWLKEWVSMDGHLGRVWSLGELMEDYRLFHRQSSPDLDEGYFRYCILLLCKELGKKFTSHVILGTMFVCIHDGNLNGVFAPYFSEMEKVNGPRVRDIVTRGNT